MDCKKALNIPFKVEKDYVVTWTKGSPNKRKYCDSQLLNGSNLFDHDLAAKISLEFKRRKSCVILADILKTDQGKTHLGKIKQRCNLGEQEQVASDLPKGRKNKEEPSACRDKTPSLKSFNKDTNKNTTQKWNKKPVALSPQRRNSKTFVEEVVRESAQRMRVSKDCEEDYKFSEVVDCGLSVRWEPPKDTGACREFSPAGVKETWTDPGTEVLQGLDKRKRNVVSFCSRGGDGGQVLTNRSPEKHIKNGRNAESMSTEVSAEESEKDSSQDSLTGSSSPDTIVLSSDEGESCDASRCSNLPDKKTASIETSETEELSAQEDEQEASESCRNMQLYEVVLEDLPGDSISIIPNLGYPTVHFSSLYSGAHHVKSAGHIMIGEQKVIIQLKDVKEQLEGMVMFEGKEMQWHSVWDQEGMQDKGHSYRLEVEPLLPALLLCVSEVAGALVEQELFKLCAKDRPFAETERFSPFILLTLKDSLDGIEGTLFRSLLELNCQKNAELAESHGRLHAEKIPGLTDLNSYVLSMADSIRLIRGTGLDSPLLSLIGLEDAELSLELDRHHILTRTVQKQTVIIQLPGDSQNGTMLELEPGGVSPVELPPERDQTERVSEAPPEMAEEAASVYALCHRRSGGSYTATPCKPDSGWTKYKHQGLPHRLIQFPPPPLKGGITVTAEDLQCLDSGQYLNDVIIDFYLKYLLHKAPAAIAERTHIFSSFFYKQLTRRDNAREGNIKDSCQRQRRHQRVKTWTRHVDIFKKDFLFMPVNHNAHWYLAVVCFPGLTEPTLEARDGSTASSTTEKSNGVTEEESQEEETLHDSGWTEDGAETAPSVINRVGGNPETEKSQEESTKDRKPGPVNCTVKTCSRKAVVKRPCILIMDSLKLSHHERVFKLLRDYLESEWEFRRGSSREFGPDQMQSSHCRVPLQDNSSDCGLYLLQYVETFLEDPLVHFDLPLHLERWFSRQLVRRKRNEICDLVLSLHRHQSADSYT